MNSVHCWGRGSGVGGDGLHPEGRSTSGEGHDGDEGKRGRGRSPSESDP